MEERTVGSVFGVYLSPQLADELNGGRIDGLRVNRENRILLVSVTFDCRIGADALFAAERELQNSLNMQTVSFEPHFPSESLTADAFADLKKYLKRQNVSVNGLLDDADFRLEEDRLAVTLRHGGKNILCATGVPEQLRDLIRVQYGRTLAVSLDGAETAQQDEQYVQQMKQAETEAAERARVLAAEQAAKAPHPAQDGEPARPGQPLDPTVPPANGLPIYLETAQPIMGTPIREMPTPIRQLEANGSPVTAWGQLFKMDSRDNRDGTKCRFTLSVTDLTGSLNISKWMDKKRDADLLKAFKGLKTGDNLLVCGRYEYDSYARQNLLNPRSISLVAR